MVSGILTSWNLGPKCEPYYIKHILSGVSKFDHSFVVHNLFQVRALEKHSQRCPDYHVAALDKSNTPQSEVEVDNLHEWIDSQKPYLKEVETDVRDAKRRVSLAKGPKKKVQTPAEGSASENEAGSVDDDDDA